MHVAEFVPAPFTPSTAYKIECARDDDLLVGREYAPLPIYAVHCIDLSLLASQANHYPGPPGPIVKGSLHTRWSKLATTLLPAAEKKINRAAINLVASSRCTSSGTSVPCRRGHVDSLRRCHSAFALARSVGPPIEKVETAQ